MNKYRSVFCSVFIKAFCVFFIPAIWLVIVSPMVSTANAAEVTLAWDANSENNLAGYKLYYKTDTGGAPYDGTGLNEGDSPVTIDLVSLADTTSPTFTLTGLVEGKTYFFSLTAFDTDGMESDYSDEVSNGTSVVTTYTIAASATGQGVISPEGTVSVSAGASRTFTITPNANYHIAGVTVDGASVGMVGTYTFANVAASHTIAALFEIDTYTITATAGENGSISSEGVTSVSYGTNLSYTITPANGYHIADVLVDDSSVGQVATYSFANISSWHTIEAVFEADDTSAGGGEDTGSDGTTTDDSPVSDDGDNGSSDSGTSETQSDENSVPDMPVAVSDTLDVSAAGPVDLALGSFSDPDAGDYHAKTQWRIFRESDDLCILNTTSTTALTAFSVPAIMLEENTVYSWQARFFDNNNAASGWSDAAHFTTGFSETDLDGNGLPDSQEVDDSVDLNQDGISDAEQEIMKSILLPQSNQSIGLSIENSDTAMAILFMERVDVDNMSISDTNKGRARKLPFGLINFKLAVAEPGDTATVTVHFSEAAHPRSKWMKLDVIDGVWLDYSGYSQLSDDRMSMTLELVDGGFGDDDGVANGIIVDPAGLERAVGDEEGLTPTEEATEEDVVSSGIDSKLNGCFITGAMEDDYAGLPMAALGILFLIGAAAVMCAGRKAHRA